MYYPQPQEIIIDNRLADGQVEDEDGDFVDVNLAQNIQQYDKEAGVQGKNAFLERFRLEIYLEGDGRYEICDERTDTRYKLVDLQEIRILNDVYKYVLLQAFINKNVQNYLNVE